MKQIFLYVGHSNYGKSYALKALTDGNSHKKSTQINGKKIKVRKMSNDDDENKLLNFVQDIKNSDYKYYVIAYCPKQEKSKNAKKILNILKEFGNLFFFVQKNRYSNNEEILPEEIDGLKKYGKVEILKGKIEYGERCEEFKKFIINNIK
ncbi:hypothetical protein PG279_05810 [Riemerella anatipestifer]|nr:hypothetical protein [Riemerella anatipestifer]